MKKRVKYILMFISLNISLSCINKYRTENFNIKYTNFYGSEGFSLTYKINQDSIKIHYDCDFENCKDTIIYNKKLKEEDIYKFYKVLKLLRTDTLKRRYIGEGIGHDVRTLEINGDSLTTKSVRFRDYYHPEIEKLTYEIDKLIEENKFKINRK